MQADVLDRPVRERRFDVVWSFGALHRMTDPRVAFQTIAPLARPDGGLVVIWVYGYRGMSLTYRLSHMRAAVRMARPARRETAGEVGESVGLVMSARGR